MHALLEAPVGFDTPAMNLTKLREICSVLSDDERIAYDFFKSSPDLLAVVNKDWTFVHTNPAWHDILGINNHTSLLDLIRREDKSIITSMGNELSEHDVKRTICRLNYKSLTVEFSATRWHDGYSNLIGRIVPDTCLRWRAHANSNET